MDSEMRDAWDALEERFPAAIAEGGGRLSSWWANFRALAELPGQPPLSGHEVVMVPGGWRVRLEFPREEGLRFPNVWDGRASSLCEAVLLAVEARWEAREEADADALAAGLVEDARAYGAVLDASGRDFSRPRRSLADVLGEHRADFAASSSARASWAGGSGGRREVFVAAGGPAEVWEEGARGFGPGGCDRAPEVRLSEVPEWQVWRVLRLASCGSWEHVRDVRAGSADAAMVFVAEEMGEGGVMAACPAVGWVERTVEQRPVWRVVVSTGEVLDDLREDRV